MDELELSRLLGIKPKEAKVYGGFSGIEETPKGATRTLDSDEPKGDYCLKLDSWDKEQGERLERKNSRRNGGTRWAWADFFGAAYLPDPERVPCKDAQREQFLNSVMDSSDFRMLKESTYLNDLTSDLAAEKLADGYANFLRERHNGKPEDEEMIAAGEAAEALQNAQAEVDSLNDTMSALGCGSDPGTTTSPMDVAKTIQVFDRVRHNAMLKRICELAGRWRMMAQSKQRQKVLHGYDDMVGVTLSGDVGRILPAELAKLAHPLLKMDSMRRLVERQTMSRDYRGVEKMGKGPIIICVDESGSMTGEKICQAKAFALAMYWIARHQRRWCCFVSYSSGPFGRYLCLPHNKPDETALLDWLGGFIGAGTDMEVPFRKLPGEWWSAINPPRGKTDMLILTDGQVQVDPQLEAFFLDWKRREKVRTIGLMIGARGRGGLDSTLDDCYSVGGSVSFTDAGFQKAMSI